MSHHPLTGAVPLFQVFDMPTAVDFYTRALGFQIYQNSGEIAAAEGRYFHWCWLRAGQAELMLNTAYDANQRPPEPDSARWRGHGDAGLSIGCEDVDALRRQLLDLGHAPSEIRQANGMRTFSLRDPDGYDLMFVQPDSIRPPRPTPGSDAHRPI